MYNPGGFVPIPRLVGWGRLAGARVPTVKNSPPPRTGAPSLFPSQRIQSTNFIIPALFDQFREWLHYDPGGSGWWWVVFGGGRDELL